MARFLMRERRALIVGPGLFGDLAESSPPLVSEVDAVGAVALSCSLQPDVVVVDASATHDLVRLVAGIRDVSTETSVIVVGEPWTDGELTRAIAAGASGFVGRHDPMLPLLGTLIGARPPLGACA
jgi:DNA-binding NarL/FixJ family response regulator